MKLWIVSADRLIGLVRLAFPRNTCFGDDCGGDNQKIIRFIQNETEMERIASAIWEIDYAFEKATKSHIEAVLAAAEQRAISEKALVKTIS